MRVFSTLLVLCVVAVGHASLMPPDAPPTPSAALPVIPPPLLPAIPDSGSKPLAAAEGLALSGSLLGQTPPPRPSGPSDPATQAPTPAPTAAPSGPRWIVPVMAGGCNRATAGCCASDSDAASKCCNPCGGTSVLVLSNGDTCSSYRRSQCCKSPEETCCNKQCFVAPVSSSTCTSSLRASTCCTATVRSCCNPCGGAFTELESEIQTAQQVIAEAEATLTSSSEIDLAAYETIQGDCTPTIQASRCCATPATQCCSNPCQGTRIGDMQMGKLCTQRQQDTCCTQTQDSCCKKCDSLQPVQVVVSNPCSQETRLATCCSSSVTSCCRQCNNNQGVSIITVPVTMANQCSDSQRASTCCTAAVRSCCNPCGGAFTEISATTEVDVSSMTEAQLAAYETIQGDCTPTIQASRCCATAATQCCSNPCQGTRIGDMQMGKLCTQQERVSTCCTDTQTACCRRCNKQFVEPEVVSSCTDSIRTSTCCSASRSSCCSPCGSFAEVGSEIDATEMKEPADDLANADSDDFSADPSDLQLQRELEDDE